MAASEMALKEAHSIEEAAPAHPAATMRGYSAEGYPDLREVLDQTVVAGAQQIAAASGDSQELAVGEPLRGMTAADPA